MLCALSGSVQATSSEGAVLRSIVLPSTSRLLATSSAGIAGAGQFGFAATPATAEPPPQAASASAPTRQQRRARPPLPALCLIMLVEQ